MNLTDKYRPRTLSDIVGQPAMLPLRFLVRSPRRSCWLLEGDPGTGKTATAHAFAEDLGCGMFSKHPVKASDLNKETAEQLLGRTLRCYPMDRAPMHVVVLEEFERCVSPEVKAYLKVALDTGIDPEDGGLPQRCIVLATSNDASKVEPALLERFRVIPYSSGPEFASACWERLGAIWEAEGTGGDMPQGWMEWGWRGTRYSMRMALRELAEVMEVMEVLRGRVAVH